MSYDPHAPVRGQVIQYSPLMHGNVIEMAEVKQPTAPVVYIRPPQTATPMMVCQQPIMVHQHPQPVASESLQKYAPQGKWADSICDWPSNLFPSCYCACCFLNGMYITAQMAQKTGFGTFKNALIGYFICLLIGFFLSSATGNGGFLWILPAAFAFCYSISLRLYIARKDNINECGTNPCFGECCCGFWCWYCSVAQMARHVYGYKQVLDGDADPERKDGYMTVQNQV